jgi:hypothetical protein
MNININDFAWTREPGSFSVSEGRVEVVTKPHTDLWQRTYYHFRNDNAPVFQMETEEKYFSFTVKTAFESKHRFDQCGVVMYLDSENWLKASIEYENEEFQHLGSVVTNLGYLTGPPPPSILPSSPCGTASAAGRTIIAWSALLTANISAKCGSATCTKVAAPFDSVSTPVVRRILLSGPPLQTLP